MVPVAESCAVRPTPPKFTVAGVTVIESNSVALPQPKNGTTRQMSNSAPRRKRLNIVGLLALSANSLKPTHDRALQQFCRNWLKDMLNEHIAGRLACQSEICPGGTGAEVDSVLDGAPGARQPHVAPGANSR